MVPLRKIIHIDMDAFFAAVEQRDFPEYRNKPLIVGGNPFSRGVVATCNYEARPFGIHSAMPCSQAYRLCPDAIFVKPRFEAYREASQQIRQIFFEYTNRVEPLSLDEAYLDVTDSLTQGGSATSIAQEIKTRIQQKTQLTASAGISYNKFLAKIASDLNKPDGFYLIRPQQGALFIENLPIHKFHGVGKATTVKMHALGIHTGKDLKQWSLEDLNKNFGKSGTYFYQIARGIDNRPVLSQRESQSIGVEITFQDDMASRQDVLEQLNLLFDKAFAKVTEKDLVANTVTLKVKYHDFVQITRSRTLPTRIQATVSKTDLLLDLLKHTEVGHRNVRLLGITFSSLKRPAMESTLEQLDLFHTAL